MRTYVDYYEPNFRWNLIVARNLMQAKLDKDYLMVAYWNEMFE